MGVAGAWGVGTRFWNFDQIITCTVLCSLTRSLAGIRFTQCSQHRKHTTYKIYSNARTGELQLLNGVSGVFLPGVLTSLMGASGAGKTTLMDVLAGRKTGGRAEGRQVVNGAPKHMGTFARQMGYVEQFDAHNPQVRACGCLKRRKPHLEPPPPTHLSSTTQTDPVPLHHNATSASDLPLL